MEQKEWIIVTETSVGGVYEKKDGSVIVTSTYDGKGMIHTVHYKNATQTPTTEHIPEEIIREWIEKAKPLVDNAFNLGYNQAIDHCMEMVRKLNDEVFPETPSYSIINGELIKLKKEQP